MNTDLASICYVQNDALAVSIFNDIEGLADHSDLHMCAEAAGFSIFSQQYTSVHIALP